MNDPNQPIPYRIHVWYIYLLFPNKINHSCREIPMDPMDMGSRVTSILQAHAMWRRSGFTRSWIITTAWQSKHQQHNLMFTFLKEHLTFANQYWNLLARNHPPVALELLFPLIFPEDTQFQSDMVLYSCASKACESFSQWQYACNVQDRTVTTVTVPAFFPHLSGEGC